MKRLIGMVAVTALLVGIANVGRAESVVDVINRRLGTNLNDVSIGEKLAPKQFPQVQMKQAPQFQAPMKAELQANIQAPSKFAPAVVRKAHMCSLIPGRARRLARREARQSAALQARLEGRTLLEIDGPPGRTTMLESGGGRTIMENGTCTSCISTAAVVPARTSDIAGSLRGTPVTLTSLTTRELLEGGQISRQQRTINEPGVCGSGGQCNGGGRRGLFRR